MNANAEGSNPVIDYVLWAVVFALVGAGVYANSYFAGESVLYRALGLLGVAVVAALIALQTTKGKAFWELVKGARIEIRKVVWPTRQETVQTTLLVLGFVILAGIILWGLDTALGWIVSKIIG